MRALKIAYCLNSIRGLGGIERVTVKKANALAAIAGNQVYVLVSDNKRGHIGDILDELVHLIDLDINYYDDDWQKGWRARISQISKKKNHKKILRKTLNTISPDVVIAVGQSEKFFLTKGFLNNSSTVYIRELHFATDYRILLARSLKERALGKIQNLLDYGIICKRYNAVVCLTPQDLDAKWKGRPNAYFMPNPLTVEFPPQIADRSSKKIITLGRLSQEKNHISFIQAFSKIASHYPEWGVEIYGRGEELFNLENRNNELQLKHQVLMVDHTNNVSEKLDTAALFVLTSKTEGFPLVILEAMAHGLPVIAYACPFGPSYIINDKKDGVLIPLDDEEQLAAAIEYLVLNEEVRARMGQEGRRRAGEFLPETIALQWMTLFNNLISKKLDQS